MTKNKLYTLLAIACFFGYIWLGFSFFTDQFQAGPKFNACIFKNLTSYPCPSCGTTRSVKMMLQGDFYDAMMMNPIGIIVGLVMVLAPLWLLFDTLAKKQTLFEAYQKTEKIMANKKLAILLIILVLLNWIWNLNKPL